MAQQVTLNGEVFYLVKAEAWEKLTEEVDWLMCLEAAGVDNWEGYDQARALQCGEDVY
jgi:hypothetical protein